MTHTKGPWRLEKAHDDYILLHKNIWFMNLIGRWYPSEVERQEHEANARLIAAAPDLLEALKRLVAYAKGDEDLLVDEPLLKGIEAIQKATQ